MFDHSSSLGTGDRLRKFTCNNNLRNRARVSATLLHLHPYPHSRQPTASRTSLRSRTQARKREMQQGDSARDLCGDREPPPRRHLHKTPSARATEGEAMLTCKI